MAELVRLVVELLHMLWPVRIVWHWQRGVYFFAGRAMGTVGPGLKLIFPYLCDVRNVSVVPEVYLSPLQSVVLRDGKTLAFSASFQVVVVDALKAYTAVGHWNETVLEIASAVLSEGLADAAPERFDPAYGKKDRLLEEVRKTINGSLSAFGLEVTAIRLNNFVPNIRTLRLLTDRAILEQHSGGH